MPSFSNPEHLLIGEFKGRPRMGVGRGPLPAVEQRGWAPCRALRIQVETWSCGPVLELTRGSSCAVHNTLLVQPAKCSTRQRNWSCRPKFRFCGAEAGPWHRCGVMICQNSPMQPSPWHCLGRAPWPGGWRDTCQGRGGRQDRTAGEETGLRSGAAGTRVPGEGRGAEAASPGGCSGMGGTGCHSGDPQGCLGGECLQKGEYSRGEVCASLGFEVQGIMYTVLSKPLFHNSLQLFIQRRGPCSAVQFTRSWRPLLPAAQTVRPRYSGLK